MLVNKELGLKHIALPILADCVAFHEARRPGTVLTPWHRGTMWTPWIPILAVLMILGNGSLILVTLRHKKLRTVTNLLIASLALSDLLMGLVIVLLTSLLLLLTGIQCTTRDCASSRSG